MKSPIFLYSFLLLFCLSINCLSQVNIEQESTTYDLDEDGMDDDWEIENNLDPDNPKDAWWDLDGDHVKNLFEYQMDTDPNDVSSPEAVQFDASLGIDSLFSLIYNYASDVGYIQISEGQFLESGFLAFANSKFVLQGGWNQDFTEYNPDEYITELHGRCWILNNDVSSGKNALILEGLNFMANNYYSPQAALDISNRAGESYVSLNDCNFFNCQFTGLHIETKSESAGVDVYASNLVFSNNGFWGLRHTSYTSAEVSFNLLNSTIYSNSSAYGGGGFYCTSANLSKLNIINSILWSEGEVNSLVFSTNTLNDHTIELSASHSNIGMDVGEMIFDNSDNLINENPQFQDASSNELNLKYNSPCIDLGTDLGFDYMGNAPDMGAVESDVVSGIGLVNNQFQINNPVSNELIIRDENFNGILYVQIFSLEGELFLTDEFQHQSESTINIGSLSSGVYILKVNAGTRCFSNKVIKL